MSLVTYSSPYPGGWHNFPARDTALNASAMQTLDDAINALANAVNFLNTRSAVTTVYEPVGGWAGGNRPATTGAVIWVGVDSPPSGGTTAGGGGFVAGLDLWAIPS